MCYKTKVIIPEIISPKPNCYKLAYIGQAAIVKKLMFEHMCDPEKWKLLTARSHAPV